MAVCKICKGKKYVLTLGYSDGHCPICHGTGEVPDETPPEEE